jgi:hypothetical protein
MHKGESENGKYQAEVQAAGDPPGHWSGNGLKFDNKDDAITYVLDLGIRWTAVKRCRVVKIDYGKKSVVWLETEHS